MARHSFRDPLTGVLSAHGFVLTNNPSDVRQVESDDFNLDPGKWRWDGAQWVPFVAPPKPPSDLVVALDTAISAVPSIDPRIKAVFVEWRKQIF